MPRRRPAPPRQPPGPATATTTPTTAAAPAATTTPTTPATPGPDEAAPLRILILTASMGAGHDGAAREVAHRLRTSGHHAEVRDFLHSAPVHIGKLLKRIYLLELRYLPSAYDMTYRLWYRAPWLCGAIARFVTFLTRRRVLAWIRESRAAAVVSTYPLATLCLGRLRDTGELQVPVVNYITDFGVHPLWVHPGVDLNLAVHDLPARVAESRSGVETVACGPAVSDRFAPSALPDRNEARRRLGLPTTATTRAALIAAGSWGIGSVDPTWDAVVAAGFVPVVACGRDERLRRALSIRAESLPLVQGVALGWTDDMPAVMAACDVVVENAGGLMAFEAMRAGVPVVSFRPIAGHGKENAAAMASTGVTQHPRDADELRVALTQLADDSRAQVAAGRAVFRSDPGTWIIKAAASAEPKPAPDQGPSRTPVVATR